MSKSKMREKSPRWLPVQRKWLVEDTSTVRCTCASQAAKPLISRRFIIIFERNRCDLHTHHTGGMAIFD